MFALEKIFIFFLNFSSIFKSVTLSGVQNKKLWTEQTLGQSKFKRNTENQVRKSNVNANSVWEPGL